MKPITLREVVSALIRFSEHGALTSKLLLRAPSGAIAGECACLDDVPRTATDPKTGELFEVGPRQNIEVHYRMVCPPNGFADAAEWSELPDTSLTTPSVVEREKRAHELWECAEREYHRAWKAWQEVERELRDEEFASLGEHPSPDDLVYAATQVCLCGAGLAHPKGVGPRGAWWCSAVLLRKAPRGGDDHAGPMRFAEYDMTREGDPGAEGRTTRPARS